LELAKNLLDEVALTQGSILERIDEYSLYCYYLGYEPIPGKKYRSPIRSDDDNPSFNIFYVTNNVTDKEFMWRDQATGTVGDIFRLVQLMHNPVLTGQQALIKVASDFGLITDQSRPTEKIVFHKAPKKTDIEIHIHSRKFTKNELAYWAKYNISPQLLAEYNVSAFDFYWLMRGQVVPFTAPEYSFSYRIENRYKLYWPFAKKEDKFRNNFKPDDVEGLTQYSPSDLLIITKATKDVLFLRSIGYMAVAPKAESTPISSEIIERFLNENRRVVTFFDNDGKHKGSEYTANYGIEGLTLPIETGYKDLTDMAAGAGVGATKTILNELLSLSYN